MHASEDRDGAAGATSAVGAAAPEAQPAAEQSNQHLNDQDVAQDARLYMLPGLEGQVRRRHRRQWPSCPLMQCCRPCLLRRHAAVDGGAAS